LLLAPTGIVIVAGRLITSGSPPLNVTTTDDPRAVPFRFTVSATVAPPPVLFGLIDTEETCRGATVTVTLRVTPAYDADSVTGVELVTVPAVAVKLADDAPAATVTDAGLEINDEDDASETMMPPLGAGPESVTFPVADRSLTIMVGLMLMLSRAAGVTVSVADTVSAGPVAEMSVVVEAVTTFEVTEKVALVDPAGTTTVAGTVATVVLLEARVMVSPPAGAGALSFREARDDLPPVTEAGDSASDATSAADMCMGNAVSRPISQTATSARFFMS
jgi:hypothetical protein